ncbi:MAG: hypothetical protein HQ567_00625 [Candidatus Nealsonbacteria bacterium]|nr:hypothetical protein [Candidatus Nealsonbacteria bacterium]
MENQIESTTQTTDAVLGPANLDRGVLDWAAMIAIEPRLQDLIEDAARARGIGRTEWSDFSTLKRRLTQLVGWWSTGDERLATIEAYDNREGPGDQARSRVGGHQPARGGRLACGGASPGVWKQVHAHRPHGSRRQWWGGRGQLFP